MKKKKQFDSIDLREELSELVSEYGHWIVLRQAIPGRKCSCVNPVTAESRTDCNLCLGSGRAYIDKFVRGRKSRDVGIMQNIGSESRAWIGFQTSPDYVFYIEYTTRPTQEDYVLEVKLDIEDQEPAVPVVVTNIYDISDVREMRSDQGRVEFYAVTAERQSWSEFVLGSE